jgi:hypothetical protein
MKVHKITYLLEYFIKDYRILIIIINKEISSKDYINMVSIKNKLKRIMTYYISYKEMKQ